MAIKQKTWQARQSLGYHLAHRIGTNRRKNNCARRKNLFLLGFYEYIWFAASFFLEKCVDLFF